MRSGKVREGKGSALRGPGFLSLPQAFFFFSRKVDPQVQCKSHPPVGMSAVRLARIAPAMRAYVDSGSITRSGTSGPGGNKTRRHHRTMR